MPDKKHPMAHVGIFPMFHAFCMVSDQNVVIEGEYYDNLFPKPPSSMKEAVDTILEVGPEGGVIVPRVENLFIGLTRYLKNIPEPRLKNLFQLCVSGAGALHKPVKNKCEAVRWGKLVEAYGLTECPTAISAEPFNLKVELGKIGLP